ncbi:hypothetical protein ACFU6K_30370 [Kitasatospora sp. NPDC057512]
MADGGPTGGGRTLLELDMAAGLQPKRLAPAVPDAEQSALF